MKSENEEKQNLICSYKYKILLHKRVLFCEFQTGKLITQISAKYKIYQIKLRVANNCSYFKLA